MLEFVLVIFLKLLDAAHFLNPDVRLFNDSLVFSSLAFLNQKQYVRLFYRVRQRYLHNRLATESCTFCVRVVNLNSLLELDIHENGVIYFFIDSILLQELLIEMPQRLQHSFDTLFVYFLQELHHSLLLDLLVFVTRLDL